MAVRLLAQVEQLQLGQWQAVQVVEELGKSGWSLVEGLAVGGSGNLAYGEQQGGSHWWDTIGLSGSEHGLVGIVEVDG